MNGSGTLDLETFGDISGFCTTFNMKNNDSYIRSLEVGYSDEDGVIYVGIVDEDYKVRVFGEKGANLNNLYLKT